uniref:Uncharacterized protein n=1 Tax=Ixodes ricinus TaxID=34613 RepID=A0A6B0UBL8_IXORI
MLSQIGILSKGLGALLALKWLFTSVHSIMLSQIGILSKGLGALLALKWLFTCVCSIMALQMGHCLAKLAREFRAKAWGQSLHLYGFSPVCV